MLPNLSNPRQWGKFCLVFGLSGLLLLYGVGLIPAVQGFISRAETGVFTSLNPILGRNPVWDWTILVAASRVWCYVCYGLAAAFCLACAWRRRTEDYGQLFGYILFIALVVYLTENLADLIAANLHRVLPWKDGIVDRIRDQYGVSFLGEHTKEGIVDDAACALFCLLFLVVPRLPRAALALLGLLGLYILSSLIAGTQWVTVQVASAFMGALFAGAGLVYGATLIRNLERESSRLLIACAGHLLLAHKIHETAQDAASQRFWQAAQAVARRARLRGSRWFWDRVVKRQAAAMLNADPAQTRLYPSPDLTMTVIKSSRRVRFLQVGAEVFVIRATRHIGGALWRSQQFTRFTDGIKNNILLHRLGFPVPRVLWTQEGVATLGLRHTFFAIEEFLPSQDLDARDPEPLGEAMAVLARLHGHTQPQWGSLYSANDQTLSRAQYVLAFLRGEVLYNLKRIDKARKLALSPQRADAVWKQFEAAALDLFAEPAIPFRLTHGDVTPRNIRLGADGRICLIDFTTVRADLAGWEVVKAAVSLTRGCPAHCPAAWQAYFEAAGEARWREFQREAPLAFARYALRELAQGRVRLSPAPGETTPEETVGRWLEELFTRAPGFWGATPADTRWDEVFQCLGIHQPPAKSAPDALASAGSANG